MSNNKDHRKICSINNIKSNENSDNAFGIPIPTIHSKCWMSKEFPVEYYLICCVSYFKIFLS